MIICILSGKGGAGKTFVACSLAKEFSRFSKVLLVDADVECPNASLFFQKKLANVKMVSGFVPEIDGKLCKLCYACAKVCRKNAIFYASDKTPVIFEELCNSCGACIIACKQNAIKKREKKIGEIRKYEVSENLKILEGILREGEEEPMPVVKELLGEVRKISREFDFVIIDAPPGVKCNALACIETCNLAIVVAEATTFGMADAELAIKACELLRKEFFIVLNKLREESEIKEFVKAYGEKIACEIPFTTEILHTYSAGRLPKINEIKSLVEKLVKEK